MRLDLLGRLLLLMKNNGYPSVVVTVIPAYFMYWKPRATVHLPIRSAHPAIQHLLQITISNCFFILSGMGGGTLSGCLHLEKWSYPHPERWYSNLAITGHLVTWLLKRNVYRYTKDWRLASTSARNRLAGAGSVALEVSLSTGHILWADISYLQRAN